MPTRCGHGDIFRFMPELLNSYSRLAEPGFSMGNKKEQWRGLYLASDDLMSLVKR